MQEFERSPRPDHEQHVRKVVLPSGRTIEVVCVDDLGPAVRDLHICRQCGSQLVQPVAWEQAARGSWEVLLRCPDCEWSITGTFEDQTIERFDETLERGTEALASDLRQLARANMKEDVERFAAALCAGHVLPEDF